MRDAQAQARGTDAASAGKSAWLGGLRGPQAIVKHILGAPIAEGRAVGPSPERT
jgi:hypothetical protein